MLSVGLLNLVCVEADSELQSRIDNDISQTNDMKLELERITTPVFKMKSKLSKNEKKSLKEIIKKNEDA